MGGDLKNRANVENEATGDETNATPKSLRHQIGEYSPKEATGLKGADNVCGKL